MKFCFIGIDTGENGGIAFIDENKQILKVATIPYDSEGRLDFNLAQKAIGEFTCQYKCYAEIEKAQMFKIQKHAASYLISYGVWISVLKTSLLTFNEVHAVTWTKAICNPDYTKLSYSEKKKQNILLAKKLLPEWKPSNINEAKRQADSLLLALYARKVKAIQLNEKIKGNLFIKKETAHGLLTKPKNSKASFLKKTKLPEDYFKL